MYKLYYDLQVKVKDGETYYHRRLTHDELLTQITFYVNRHIRNQINIEELIID